MLEPHAFAAIAMTIAALLLFTRERIPIEYSSLAVLAVLVVGFEIFPYGPAGDPALRGSDFLRGFGNEALITVCLLLVAAKAIDVSGALRPISGALVRAWSWNRSAALLLTLSVTVVLSAFVNNTPVVVMLMPVLIGVAHRMNTAPSHLLMPCCFAATLGGMTTTIGSSTNLLVVNVAADLGLPRIGMFDFVMPAGAAALCGVLYLWLVAPRWLPDRASPLEAGDARIFFTVVEIHDGSEFAGRTLGELLRSLAGQARIERLERAGIDLVRLPSLSLKVGDRVQVRGSPEALTRLQELAGGEFTAGGLSRGPDQRLVEVVVTRASTLNGKRLSELRSAALARLFPVGIQHPGNEALTPMEVAGDPRLRVGDVLLLQGRMRDINELKEARDYPVLDRTIHVPRRAGAWPAALILIAAVLAAATALLPIIVSAFSAVILLLVTRCLHWDEAWSAVDKSLVLIIVTSLALGTALSETGATAFIAQRFVAVAGDWPVPVVLSGFLLMTALLNEVVSNNAVAVIGTPIAIGIAEQIGAPAFPFVLAVLFGANAGYITPIGYQTNLLVFSAGGYRFSDFVRVGFPLQILTWLVLSAALTLIYF